MSRPVVSDAAERIYDRLRPYQLGDEAAGWLLLALCEALSRTLVRPNELLRHDDTGTGWRRLLDADRAPAWALPFLAQWVGVAPLPRGLTEQQTRDLIRDAPGLRRGTPAAIVTTARRYLTGHQTVLLRERDGDPYFLTIVTRTAETPDPDALLRAVVAEQKPIGIVLSHVVEEGETWDEVPDTVEWDDVDAGTSWDDMRTTTL